MFCSRCSQKLNKSDAFCPNCGTPVETVANQESDMPVNSVVNNTESQNNVNISTQNVQEKNKKGSVVLIAVVVSIACILFDVIVFGGFLFLIGTVLNNYEEQEYISLGTVEVVSFFDYEDDASLCSFSEKSYSSGNSVVINVCYYTDFEDDVDDYFDYLIDYYGYRDVYTRKDRKIVKEVNNSGYVIEITVDYDDATIIYEKYLESDKDYY